MSKTDLYQEVTDRIIEALEKGDLPWIKPWTTSGPPTRQDTGQAYKGVNVFLLGMSRDYNGWDSNEWYTFKQAKARGASVRKGQKGTQVIKWIFKDRTEKDPETGEEITVKATRGFLVKFTVFNRDQIDGLPPEAEKVERPPMVRHAEADRILGAVGADIEHGGDRAYYDRARDLIRMPHGENFISPDAYYSVLSHELTHWTGAAHRLERKFGDRFGDERYAVEELVAEMGAAFMCAAMGIDGKASEDYAGYLQSWLKVLKADNRAIFTAASKAQAAADYLLAFSASEEALAA
jgi:antirestriction protein ArdC